MAKISLNFDEIKDSRKVTGVCQKCGKRRTRTVSDYQTVNPFNKDKNGQPESASQIAEEVKMFVTRDADILRNNFLCATCEDLTH